MSDPALGDETPWRVLGTRGCGSAIVEAALVLAKIPYTREEVDYTTPAGHDKLVEVNPLAQVPTVVLPDGTVMTKLTAGFERERARSAAPRALALAHVPRRRGLPDVHVRRRAW